MIDLILLELPETHALVDVRPGRPGDAVGAGEAMFRAFSEISGRHGFSPGFPSVEAAVSLAANLLDQPKNISAVAEIDGRVVGSAFADVRSAIAGFGPITIDSDAQNAGVGRRLLRDLLDRVEREGVLGSRLMAAAYHGRAIALYASCGFLVREQIAVMQGPAINVVIPGKRVRPAHLDDAAACNRLAVQVHGLDRNAELLEAIAGGSALVVESSGRITGYTTGAGYFGHSIGETNADLSAILGDATSLAGPGVLVPIRNHGLFQWCLQHGLRIESPLVMMTKGFYQEAEGVYLPSIYS